MIRNELQGRVLVTGAAGMLGSQLLLSAPAGVEAIGTDVAEPRASDAPRVALPGVDLADGAAVERLFAEAGPFAGVLHAAAYTAVDRAEEEAELAERVNGLAPELLAGACGRSGVPLVLVGTDFVFDGTKGTPYREEDETAPLGVYGRTKLSGETRARAAGGDGLSIVRTQWLYGPRGGHFPGTILRLAAERDALQVVSDQVGSPTSTLELAPALWDVLAAGRPGVYHAACDGACSWFDLAVATLSIAAEREGPGGRLAGVSIAPCTTEQFPRPAPRPAYSVLDTSRLAGLRGRTLKPWREALRDFLEIELGPVPTGGPGATAPHARSEER